MTEPPTEPGSAEPGSIEPEPAAMTPIDLDAIAADLDGVERALGRLDDGTYWSDELTGNPIPDELLAASPTRRSSRDAGPR